MYALKVNINGEKSVLNVDWDWHDSLSADLPWDAVAETETEAESAAWAGHTLSKTHKSGWAITARPKEDYFIWCTDFFAEHPIFGEISGSYADGLHASSIAAIQHFIQHHPANVWDHDEI